ncbi:hypothetical protein [Actinomadura sp. NTSP31]|uniref:hypothetical protein n=1 Tax=Actinomadura sp. NTSP31 TaxID=1735447 RepID=UPI0035BF1EB0
MHYRPGRARHCNPDSAARAHLTAIAREEAASWQADQLAAAADAINAKLGRPVHRPQEGYRDLVGRVELCLAPGAAEAVAQLRDHQAHVERLRYLKAALYTDPALLLIDHLHRVPQALTGDVTAILEDYRRLADQLEHHEPWWADVRRAWNELAARTHSRQGASESMHVLVDVIMRLDSRLAAEHGLPPPAR